MFAALNRLSVEKRGCGGLVITRRLMQLLLAVGIIPAAILVGVSPAAAKSVSPSCSDVFILGARGSGQVYNDQKVGGWYADVVGRTVESFKQQVTSRDPGIKFHDMALSKAEYPADKGFNFVDAGLQLPLWYHDSVTRGKDSGRKRVRAVIDRPGACVLFAGYSQGAQIAGDLMEEFTRSHPNRILGGFFYGDPYFRGDSAYSSSGRWPVPYDVRRRGGLGERGEFPPSLGGRVVSTCHGKDPVCQGLGSIIKLTFPPGWTTDFDGSAHSTYTRPAHNPANGGRDMTEEAADSARRIVSRMGFPRPTAPSFSGPVDIVFAIDTTGSMDNVIEQAKAYVRSFPAKNDKDLPDVRYGLVAYKDRDDDDTYSTKTIVSPTFDRAAFTSGVDSLYADGGGDYEEAVFAAAREAMNLPLRPTAKKIVIFVGDAPPHDPDLVTGLRLSDVVNRAVRENVILSAVDYCYCSGFSGLAAGTGGKVISGFGAAPARKPNPQDGNAVPTPVRVRNSTSRAAAGNPLLDAVFESVGQPEARLNVVTPSYAGEPTTINASASSDPVGYLTKYEWDFDNNGTFDKTTTQPAVQHVYRAKGPATARVRVTNDVGSRGLASSTFTVEAKPKDYPEVPPATPPAPSVALRGRTAVVTVNPALTGPTPQTYTLVEAATGNVVGVLPPAQPGLPTQLTVPKLTNGESFSFRVIASNVVGDSKPSDASEVIRVPRAKQKLANRSAFAKKVRYRGRTLLIKQRPLATAGLKSRVKIKVTPKGRKFARVVIGPKGRVAIRTYGKSPLRIKATVRAPGTKRYLPFVYTKTWKVRRP